MWQAVRWRPASCDNFAKVSNWKTAGPRRHRCRNPNLVCCESPFTKVAIDRFAGCVTRLAIRCSDWFVFASDRSPIERFVRVPVVSSRSTN